MKQEDYLNAGRCPNCGNFLDPIKINKNTIHHHCHTCNSTWEKYQSMEYGEATWGKVTGWNPPTEEEIKKYFDHYTSMEKR